MTCSCPWPHAVQVFDVGGVLTRSPLRAIRQFEIRRGLPRGYVSVAIAAAGKDGHFQRLERGERGCETHSLSHRKQFSFFWVINYAPTGEVKLSHDFLDSFGREMVSEASHEAYRRLTGHTGPLPTAMDTAALFNRIMLASCDVHQNLLDVIRRLHAAGYKTAALTNDFSVRPGLLSPAEEQKLVESQSMLRDRGLFDLVISSAATGSRKPEPAIYRVAAAQLGVKPERILFWDDIGRNLKAAQAQGWQTRLVGEKGTQEIIETLERLIAIRRQRSKL